MPHTHGRLILIASLALFTAAAIAQDEPAPEPSQQQAGQNNQKTDPRRALANLADAYREAQRAGSHEKAVTALKQMLEIRPYSGEIMYRLAAAYAQSGQKSQAFDTLIRLQKQGLAYDPRDDKAFADLRQYQLFDFVSKHLAQNAGEFNEADTAFSTGESLRWPEGIAHDPASGDFFIGGMLDGRILRVAADGSSKVFYQPDEGEERGFTALALDPEGETLWAAGTAIRAGGDAGLQINTNAAALYAFDLETGELKSRYEVDDGDRQLPHLLGELAVLPDGRVFVADGLSPLVYVREPDSQVLEPFVGSRALTSLQGLAADTEGKYLFVADWFSGLYRVDVVSKEVTPIKTKPTINLGGIHGLTFHDGNLFAIQTGTRPQRVVRLELDEDMTAVIGQQPLSANQPEYAEPGLGVMAKDGFYFVANSGWALRQRPVTTDSGPAVVLRADPELGAGQEKPGDGRVPVDLEGEPPADLEHAAPAMETGGKQSGEDG